MRPWLPWLVAAVIGVTGGIVWLVIALLDWVNQFS